MLRTSIGASMVAIGAPSIKSEPVQGDVYTAIVNANDARVPALIASASGADPGRGGIRRIAGDVQSLMAAFCAPESKHYKSQALIAPMDNAMRVILKAQYPDGTIDSGNLQSPPDTGFVVEVLATTLAVAKRNDSPILKTVSDNIQKFVLAACEALTTGGVHTPNHRWVVCNALARTNAILPNPKYVRRIDDWLGEGIDIDSD